eukprot:9251545-Karenia_brevis.AAC.1
MPLAAQLLVHAPLGSMHGPTQLDAHRGALHCGLCFALELCSLREHASTHGRKLLGRVMLPKGACPHPHFWGVVLPS